MTLASVAPSESGSAARRLRVLFVDHTSIIGGAQLVLVEHIGLLDRSAFEPIVACTEVVPELVQRLRDAGADVHITSLPRLRSAAAPIRLVSAARQLRGIIAKTRPDVVVANTSRATKWLYGIQRDRGSRFWAAPKTWRAESISGAPC